MDDAELLREYAANDSEAAFRTLVERHVALVYYAALRRVGNASLAEDVSQVVFIILARKARRLSKKTVLCGWLYRTTRFVADRAVRTESRRRQREQETVPMSASADDPVWLQLAPVLDEAIARLGQMDRTVVLLRFFENQSLRTVGRALGISEDTAQKRVSRAIIKLREQFLKLGVPVSATDTVTTISTQAAPAVPVHLVALAAAAGVGGTTGSATTAWLLQQSLRKLFWLKFSVVGGSTLLVASVATTVVSLYVAQLAAHRQLAGGTPGQASITVNVPGPLPQAASGPANIRVNLQGTPGLKYDVVYAHDTQTQQVSGVLPGQVSFKADAFAATIAVQGPGQFGLETYRNNQLMAMGTPVTFTNTSRIYTVGSRAGGQGAFIRLNTIKPLTAKPRVRIRAPQGHATGLPTDKAAGR